jgi:hypothetical protein
MPAGSGPLPVVVAAVAVGVAETVVATFPASNWNQSLGLGNLVEFSGAFTPPAAAGSLVLKVRQGATVAGVQVGPTITLPVASATVTSCAIDAVDQTAFAAAQQGGQYVVTAQYAAGAGGTLTGVATLETCAPVA